MVADYPPYTYDELTFSYLGQLKLNIGWTLDSLLVQSLI